MKKKAVKKSRLVRNGAYVLVCRFFLMPCFAGWLFFPVLPNLVSCKPPPAPEHLPHDNNAWEVNVCMHYVRTYTFKVTLRDEYSPHLPFRDQNLIHQCIIISQQFLPVPTHEKKYVYKKLGVRWLRCVFCNNVEVNLHKNMSPELSQIVPVWEETTSVMLLFS